MGSTPPPCASTRPWCLPHCTGHTLRKEGERRTFFVDSFRKGETVRSEPTVRYITTSPPSGYRFPLIAYLPSTDTSSRRFLWTLLTPHSGPGFRKRFTNTLFVYGCVLYGGLYSYVKRVGRRSEDDTRSVTCSMTPVSSGTADPRGP